MASMLNTWVVDREGIMIDEAKTVELIHLTDGEYGETFWLDYRNEFGRLVGSEPFESLELARAKALRLIGAGVGVHGRVV